MNNTHTIIINNSYLNISEIANLASCSVSLVYKVLRENNILKDRKIPDNFWTKEEDSILRSNIDLTYDQISTLLPNRTRRAIITKVSELNLLRGNGKYRRKLTEENIKFIKNNYLTYTDSELAKMFEVKPLAIANVRKKNGIKKKGTEVKGPSSIELLVRDILDNLGIKYFHDEYLLDKYRPDFYLYDYNKVIEVNGDYFHCNPSLYPNGPKDKIQLKTVKRDLLRHEWYMKNNIEVYYVWEKEINNNIDSVIDLIKNICPSTE